MVHRQEKGKIIKVFLFTVPNDEHEVSEGCVADVFEHAHDLALISRVMTRIVVVGLYKEWD